MVSLTEAYRLTVAAQNALLKTLEEPPGPACFVLTCARPRALLATVRSRCQLLRVRPTASRNAVQRLEEAGVARALAPLAAALVGDDAVAATSLLEAGGQYTVQYDSPLSRAQRAGEAAGLMRTVETALNLVAQSQNPEPLDWFDGDTIVPEVSEIQAVPARWMRSLDQVKIIRQGRARQQQVATAVEAAPAMAGLMKNAKAA